MIGKLWLTAVFGMGMALGQAPIVPGMASTAASSAPVKRLAFDVVSIRQIVDSTGSGPKGIGPTPDGYRMTNLPLMLAVMIAYPPHEGGAAMFTEDRVVGLPDWTMRDRYAIDAKVSEADLPEWQKPAAQPAMLQAMLQTLLADRCKIQVHRESKESSVYSLVVGKNGPKFKQTDPAVPHPAGMTLPGGATVVPSENGGMTLYGTSIGGLATMLAAQAHQAGWTIQDKTGLAGLYDVVIPRQDMGSADGHPLDSTDKVLETVSALGLKLESTKAQVETLVIDHIERPSAN
jgi:uncharacterized protein (TIGR03435 family)